MTCNNFSETKFLTGMRAYAALGVFLIHSGGASLEKFGYFANEIVMFGKYGVVVFFVLSAVTICMSVERSTPFHFKNYILRRSFRIIPLYYLVLLFGYFAGGATYYLNMFGIQNDINGLLWHLSFLNIFNIKYQNSIIGVEWTIPLEFCYYLVIPFIFFRIKSYDKKKIAYCLLVAFILSRLSREIFGYLYNPDFKSISEMWSMEKYFFTYICGICCYAQMITVRKYQHSSWGLLLLFVLLSLYIYAPVRQPSPVYFMSVWICLVVLLCTQRGWLSRVLFENSVTMYLGKISYSIYLTHLLVINALPSNVDGMSKFIIGLACTVGVSSVTYFLIEEPFVKYSKRLVA